MAQELVQILLDTICLPTTEVTQRRNAVVNLALLMEKHSPGADTDANYMEHLPSSLFRVVLEEADKIEIVDVLCGQLELEPIDNGVVKELFWALGKVDSGQSLIALKSALKCVLEKPLKPSELRQAILTIADLSDVVQNHDLESVVALLKELARGVQNFKSAEDRLRIQNCVLKWRERGVRDI